MLLKPTVLLLCALPLLVSAKPIKVFILAGDELILEQGVIDGRTDGGFERQQKSLAFYLGFLSTNPITSCRELLRHF